MAIHRNFIQWLIRLAIAGMCLLCASCGWQLQGAHHVSENLQPLYVEYVDLHSSFSRALQDRLQLSGVVLAENESQAKVILNVIKDNAGHRVISVSARNTPEEYEIFYSVEFTLKSRSGELLLQQPLSASQTITYDETRALAKQREENLLSDTMAAELADQLLRQIRRL
jgi:LPS-assembly lipoprotein